MLKLCQGRGSALRYFRSLCGPDGKFQPKAKRKGGVGLPGQGGSGLPGLSVLNRLDRSTVLAWPREKREAWSARVAEGQDPGVALLDMQGDP